METSLMAVDGCLKWCRSVRIVVAVRVGSVQSTLADVSQVNVVASRCTLLIALAVLHVYRIGESGL
jgi:hypothetical protein